MKNFTYAAVEDYGRAFNEVERRGAVFLAGGTNLVDLWKLGAIAVDHAIEINSQYIEKCGHRTTAKLYRVPNIQVSQRLLKLNTGAPMWMRAPGETPGCSL